MQLYIGETQRTTSYFLCYDSLKSAISTDMWGISNPDEFRCLSPALMKGSAFSMHSANKFKCSFAVIGMFIRW